MISLRNSLQTSKGAAADRLGMNPRTLRHFKLIERVGVGSFGSVWIIPRKEQLDEAEAALFLRDARAAAQLKHANIVTVHEVGKADDTIYIAMDYIEGADLREWMRGQPLPPREAAELMAKIAETVHDAHENGIVHRDLKPGNIMLTRQGEPHIMLAVHLGVPAIAQDMCRSRPDPIQRTFFIDECSSWHGSLSKLVPAAAESVAWFLPGKWLDETLAETVTAPTALSLAGANMPRCGSRCARTERGRL